MGWSSHNNHHLPNPCNVCRSQHNHLEAGLEVRLVALESVAHRLDRNEAIDLHVWSVIISTKLLSALGSSTLLHLLMFHITLTQHWPLHCFLYCFYRVPYNNKLVFLRFQTLWNFADILIFQVYHFIEKVWILVTTFFSFTPLPQEQKITRQNL